MQRLVRHIGDVGRHARDRQTLGRPHIVLEVAPAAPLWVGHDGLSSDLVKRYVLRGMASGRRDRHRAKNPPRKQRRPLQHLHAAHGAAGHAEQLIDAEMVDQFRLRAHHVANGDDREFEPEGLACSRIGGGRAGGAHAAANHVRTDDEIALGIDGLAGPDHGRPPARFVRHGIDVGDVLIARQGVADEDGVGLVGVQRAIGLVGDRQRKDIHAGVRRQRLALREPDHKAVGIVGLAATAAKKVGRLAHLIHPACSVFRTKRTLFRCSIRHASRLTQRGREAGARLLPTRRANDKHQHRLKQSLPPESP